MKILEEIRIDKGGRINLTKVFDELPKTVLVLCDTKEAAIYFDASVKDGWTANQRKVDVKGRVTVPRWIQDKLGDVYYLTAESKQTHALLSKKRPGQD